MFCVDSFGLMPFWSSLTFLNQQIYILCHQIWRVSVFLFLKTIFFRVVVSVQPNCEFSTRFPIYFLPPHMHNFLHYQHIDQGVTFFVTKDKPMLTHHNCPQNYLP